MLALVRQYSDRCAITLIRNKERPAMRYYVVTHSFARGPVQISGSVLSLGLRVSDFGLSCASSDSVQFNLSSTSSSPRKNAVNLTCRRSTQPAVTEKRNNSVTSQLPINLGSGSAQPRVNFGQTAPNRGHKKYFRSIYLYRIAGAFSPYADRTQTPVCFGGGGRYNS